MAPWWELSPNTVELLLARGMKYDSSMMEDDYHPIIFASATAGLQQEGVRMDEALEGRQGNRSR